MPHTYATRANAARAARTQIKKRFGLAYEPFEGFDYIIHPKGKSGGFYERYGYELIGPSKSEAQR